MRGEFERDVYYLIFLPNLLLIYYLIYYSAPARAWMRGEFGRDVYYLILLPNLLPNFTT
jgi:hypothetical protein